MILIIWIAILSGKETNAYHQYHDFNHRHFNSAGKVERSSTFLTNDIYLPVIEFKTKHLFQGIPNSRKIRAIHQNKKEKGISHNFRQRHSLDKQPFQENSVRHKFRRNVNLLATTGKMPRSNTHLRKIIHNLPERVGRISRASFKIRQHHHEFPTSEKIRATHQYQQKKEKRNLQPHYLWQGGTLDKQNFQENNLRNMFSRNLNLPATAVKIPRSNMSLTNNVFNLPIRGFKTKQSQSYRDLPITEKMRMNQLSQQKKRKWNFRHNNLRPNFVKRNNVGNMLRKNFNLIPARDKVPRSNVEPFMNKNVGLAIKDFKANKYQDLTASEKIRDVKQETEEDRRRPRNKKSITEQFYEQDTLKKMELFFIFVALATMLAVTIATAHYCWKKTHIKVLVSPPPLEERSRSTIGSALLQEHVLNGAHSPDLSKSESEIWRHLVGNEIDADGDKVGKRMKLERWMYQKCKCCPEDIDKIKNKLKVGKLQDVQKRSNKGTASDSLVPSPRLSPAIEHPVNAPVPGTSKQADPSNDSRHPITVNPSDMPDSLRTFDSHLNVTQQVRGMQNRKRSKSRKRKDQKSKDSKTKYSSEPFSVHDKTRKTRRH